MTDPRSHPRSPHNRKSLRTLKDNLSSLEMAIMANHIVPEAAIIATRVLQMQTLDEDFQQSALESIAHFKSLLKKDTHD